MDLNGGIDPYYLLLTDPLLSIVDNSLHHYKYILIPGRIALREAFSCVSKLAGAFVVWFSGPSHIKTTFSNPRVSGGTANSFRANTATSECFHVPTRFCFQFPWESFAALKFVFKAPGDLHPFPVLSLAAALIPPFDRVTLGMLAIPPRDGNEQMLGSLERSPCNVQHGGCNTFPEFNWTRHEVEPKTGIQFPNVLNSVLAKENQSNLLSEVLVGTGSRLVSIIRIKTLKVYAFGFYIHPDSICQKLGSKYRSVPTIELKERRDFYEDLLREDIGMTLRLVINYNGLKINTVKGAFEKSLRARLAKTNPETDFKCIAKFGSYFTEDIPLPVGTVIDFRRTVDGKLITEIGGNEIGAVNSKELCRAFFDMYLGESPVSEQTKEEIGKNVATIIRRC